jgi:hypothetical protein
MRHRLLAALVLVGMLAIATSAIALSNAGPTPTGDDGERQASMQLAGQGDGQGTAHAAEADDENTGILGGTIDRFQEAASCDLVKVGGLAGNWTHGSYVTAVAELGDPTLVPAAARSDCGKPMQAVGHGNGPPEHALQHIGQGGDDEAEHEGSDASPVAD